MSGKKDRPGGILEIPDSLGRDVDRANAGKAPAPPVEAFLSDTTLSEIEKATRPPPVHAENLIPITPQSAAAHRTQHGEKLPSMPVQRRVIPAPFRRPRISAGSHGKTWQSCRAGEVAVGDIVPDVGQVVYAGERVIHESLEGYDVAVGLRVVLAGKGGVVQVHRPEARLQVFRAVSRELWLTLQSMARPFCPPSSSDRAR
jgi:hypothetical protein